jgi:hypothetical protein
LSHHRRHVFGSLALALTALAIGGEAPEARAADCNHTDVVFYNATDTGGRLAGELKKFTSSCADYYVTVMPRTALGVEGFPRPGLAVDAIRAAGPSFHAVAEIRLTPWATYVTNHPTADSWYDAGRFVRQLMQEAGYDAGLGDTWAINEVGEPSPSQPMGVDVFRGAPGARDNLVDFIHGLYDGDGTSMPGLVFAADPMQVTANLSDYRQRLESFSADSGFWVEMNRYVRFWAQETYADVRAWGVAGSTLAARAAYLDDYFMHGERVAGRGGAGTAAARAFFEHAYTPIGSAVYRFAASTGFGSTDVDLPTMLNFVSTQTYALRSVTGARFGFADQRIGSTPLNQVIAVEDRVAAAIKDSEVDPTGACGASGEWCDSSVAGAAFTGLWRELGNPTPPTIVPHVEGPPGADGWYTGDVTVTWTVQDLESPISATTGCEPALIDADTAGTTLTCTATSFGGTDHVDVTLKRDATPPDATCAATPSTLWPPNGKLVPVMVDVTIDDATSGPGEIELTGASSSDGDSDEDIVDFDLETPDVEGLLRAGRSGSAAGREYVLTYVTHDAAGNAAAEACPAKAGVPHDQRH